MCGLQIRIRMGIAGAVETVAHEIGRARHIRTILE